MLASPLPLPSVVLWEVTYACPLRCSHCYSESGVRPSRQLAAADMLRLADVLASLSPRVVHLSGGEPLIVRGLLDVTERLQRAGVAVVLTTSGFGLTDELARGVARTCHSVHVSVDGAHAATHDRIRGRAGSFDAALAALGRLDALSRERRAAGGARVRFGIDFVVLRSNFDELDALVADVSTRFSELEFIIFNCVVPQGLASRESYERELPTDAQVAALASDAFVDALQARARRGVVVQVRDNLDLMMHPDHVAEGIDWTLDRIIVEPDGLVRALEVYEGHVGNLLRDDPREVWQRVLARREDPFVTSELAGARTMASWSAAVRRIDEKFASPDDLVRLGKRKPYGG
jgi:MoaA/NifB/PqqE/SkfB family radical SAM enzyme